MAVSTIGGNLYAASVVTVFFAPVSVAAATTVSQNVSVPGVRVTDMVLCMPNGIVAGVAPVVARPNGPDNVFVTFANVTAGSLTPPSGPYSFLIVRPEYPNATSFAP